MIDIAHSESSLCSSSRALQDKHGNSNIMLIWYVFRYRPYQLLCILSAVNVLCVFALASCHTAVISWCADRCHHFQPGRYISVITIVDRCRYKAILINRQISEIDCNRTYDFDPLFGDRVRFLKILKHEKGYYI